jgi:hypothetical protein
MLDALASLQLRVGLDVDGESAAGYQDALPD